MKIGITGGIGAGKSLVTDYLRTLGAKVICADEITHMLYRPGKAGTLAVEAAFGPSFVTASGVDRKKLGALVFSDDEAMKKLNDVMHPLIYETFNKAAQRQRLVFLDAALLIESGWHYGVDEVWLVIADQKERMKRIKERNNLTEDAIKTVMASQLPDSEKMRYADHIINNSKSREDTYCQINGLYIALQHRLNGLKEWDVSFQK